MSRTLIPASKLAELFACSEKTLLRDREDGLPVAEMRDPPGGGRKSPFFDPEECKLWYLQNRPTSKVARHIGTHCPPKAAAAARRDKAAEAQAAAAAVVAEAPPREPPANASAEDLQAFLGRVQQAEMAAHEVLERFRGDPEITPAILEACTRAYNVLATRRQNLEEAMPKMLLEKGRFCDVDLVARIVTRAFAATSTRLDQCGFVLGQKLAAATSANEVKNLIDSHMNGLKRDLRDDIRAWLK